MKPFVKVLVLCPCIVFSVWSQTTTLPTPGLPCNALSGCPAVFPMLRQFLGLTDAQVSVILKENSDYNTFSFQQQRQIQNAQSQIAVETAKDQLDPMALGTLYAGIESACRELRDRAATSQKQNLSILTDAQKAKLNTLTDAIKVIPIISEAQAGNLIGSTTPFAFSASSSGIISGVLGFPSVPGCASPFPANIIPANRLAAAPTGTWQPGVAGMNETAAKASPSSHWFTKTILEPNPAPRQ
jgi:hypothetical protein